MEINEKQGFIDLECGYYLEFCTCKEDHGVFANGGGNIRCIECGKRTLASVLFSIDCLDKVIALKLEGGK